MPYKDKDKEREYHNAYHRKWRSIPENAEHDRAYHRAWYYRHKGSEKIRRSQRNKEEREAIFQPLWKKQDGKCAICERPNPPDIDHNRKTRIVRGLLCHRCNLLLAGMESKYYAKALAYLDSHEKNPTGILYRLQHPPKSRMSIEWNEEPSQ